MDAKTVLTDDSSLLLLSIWDSSLLKIRFVSGIVMVYENDTFSEYQLSLNFNSF